MTRKFEIHGRPTPAGRPEASSDAMERFINGEDPLTTITVQIPKRLHTRLKREALDREMKMRALLIEILDRHFAESQQ
jgi:hypothetical protein